MSAADIELWFYACPDRILSIDQRHAEIMDRMSRIGAPLGFASRERGQIYLLERADYLIPGFQINLSPF